MQLEQLSECFGLMDADGSGAIDRDELGKALKLLGIHLRPREVASLVAEVDPDKTGEVDMNGFLHIMTTTMQQLSEKEQAPSVPFSLVSTAYRRKRMMEGILTGDKEVKSQLCAMQEKREHLATLQQEGYSRRSSHEGEVAHLHPSKLKASVFGKHRLEKISHLNIDEEAVASLAPDEQWAVMEALQHSTDSPPLTMSTAARLQPLASPTTKSSPQSISGITSPSPTPSPKHMHSVRKEMPLMLTLKFEKTHLIKLAGFAMDKTPSASPLRSPSSLGSHQSSPTSRLPKIEMVPDQERKMLEERLKITSIR